MQHQHTIAFQPTEFYSDMDSFKVARGRGFKWIAAMRLSTGWKIIADDCQSARAAMDACNDHLNAWASEQTRDVEF